MITREKQALLSLGTIGLLHGMIHTFSIFLSPLNAEIAGYFGESSISSITALKTTYLVVYAVSNLFFGALTNRISVRLVLGFGMVLNSIAFLLFILVPRDGLFTMHLLWLLAAVGGGVYHPVANAFITRLFPGKKGWALGITGMGAGAGFAFGPLLTGILSGGFGLGWSVIALVFGFIGTLLGVFALFAIRDLPAEPSQPRQETRGKLGFSLSLWAFLLLIILIAGCRDFVMWSVQDISDFFLGKLFSGKANTAWYLFLLNLSGVVIQPLAGILSDKVGRSRLASLSLACYGLSVGALAFLPPSLLIIPYFLMGFGQSASIPTIEALVADFATPKTRGIMFGFFITALTALGALGPLLAGFFLDGRGRTQEAFREWMLILGVLVALGALAMAAMPRFIRILGLRKTRE